MKTYTGHIKLKGESGEIRSFLIRTRKDPAKFIDDFHANNDGVEIVWMIQCSAINMQGPVV
jgi:hypothetical protein